MVKPPRRPDDGPDQDLPVADPTYIGTERAADLAKIRDGGGDGGGTTDTLDIRVAHLERRMGRVEDKLDTVIERLGAIATRPETRNYVRLSIGSFIALIAVLVTALGWLETRAARLTTTASGASPAQPQPIIIQLPYPQQPSSKHAKGD